jgi:hypothetical protein
VPSRHQSDVSHVGDVPVATESQADVRWVAPSQARDIMEMMPDQLGEPYPIHGAPAYVVDHVGLDIRLRLPLSRG